MIQLQPCPFCGAPAHSTDARTNSWGNHLVECSRCKSGGPKRATDEEAIRRWNRRRPTGEAVP